MTVLVVDDTPKSRTAAADVAVLERAHQLMTARGGTTLKRVDVHQAERELDHRLTIAAS